MLGIKGYMPNFSTTVSQFADKHEKTLRQLIGKRIDCYYLQWQTKENAWNEDGPIILQIEGNQYEFTAYKLDEYSLTINQINLSEKLDWYGANDEMPLMWKKNPIDKINGLLNRKIEQIYLLEYSMTSDIIDDKEKKEFFRQLTQSGFFIVGIEFKINGIEDCLHLSNGLDCNALKIHTTEIETKNRRIKIE